MPNFARLTSATEAQGFALGLAALIAFAILPATASARQASASSSGSTATAPQSQATSSTSGSTSASPAPADQDPLAAAARKAKQQKSQNTKPAKVFTNDDMPSSGISTVGATSSASAPGDSGATPAAASGQGEKYWRDKFASLNKKLEQDQAELDVMQRELGQLNLQNYSDPNQAMQQGYSRSDITKKTADIDAKQKMIEDDKQTISDAEDDLRKSGGDPGWAR